MGRRVCNPKDKVTGGRGDPGVGEKEAEIQGDGEQRKTTEKALWKVKEERVQEFQGTAIRRGREKRGGREGRREEMHRKGQQWRETGES